MKEENRMRKVEVGRKELGYGDLEIVEISSVILDA